MFGISKVPCPSVHFYTSMYCDIIYHVQQTTVDIHRARVLTTLQTCLPALPFVFEHHPAKWHVPVVDSFGGPLFLRPQIGMNCVVFTARGSYPTSDGIDEAREMAKRIGASSVVGIGSGGVVDTAKGTARLHTSR